MYSSPQPYTFDSNEQMVSIPPLQNLNDLSSQNMNYGVGDSFRPPFIGEDADKWSGTPNMIKMQQAEILASIPTPDQLRNISGSDSMSSLPGPNNLSFASANINNSNINISPCSQNLNHLATSSGISSSLLPSPSDKKDVINDMSHHISNPLTNQVFLSPSAQIGYHLSSNRNANLNLRQEPPNPLTVVSPWGNSTIVPQSHYFRRSLEGSSVPMFGPSGDGPNSITTPLSIQP